MTIPFENDIEQCLTVLQNGGIILYPTDTIWGIGCDATNEDAVEKIITLKQRPENKSFVVLVADERNILKYVAAPDLDLFNYLQTVQKPTTVIYPNAIGFAQNVMANDGSVGMRICSEPFCKHLIKRFQKPIVSTSANVSGEDSPPFFSMINKTIVGGVDYVVKYRQDDNQLSLPSSIIKWEKGKVVVIRE